MINEIWKEKLEYNDEWFKYKFIDEEFLNQQIAYFKTGVDTCIEHYKWGAYLKAIKNEDFSDENRVKQYFKLIENDPNEHLYRGAVRELIFDGIVTKETMKLVPNSRAWHIKSILKYIDK